MATPDRPAGSQTGGSTRSGNQFWYCHNPGGRQDHYAGPWLLATMDACEECGHIRCSMCPVE